MWRESRVAAVVVLPVEAVEKRGGGRVVQTNSTPVAECSCVYVH